MEEKIVHQLNDEVRATFLIKPALVEKIKAIAFWESAKIKDTVNTVFEDYISEYEARNGEVQIPKKVA